MDFENRLRFDKIYKHKYDVFLWNTVYIAVRGPSGADADPTPRTPGLLPTQCRRRPPTHNSLWLRTFEYI